MTTPSDHPIVTDSGPQGGVPTTWRAKCGVCNARWNVTNSAENPGPSGTFCPDCRAKKLMAPGVLNWVQDPVATPIWIDYTNYRGERGVRLILPTGRMIPGDPDFHPGVPWVIEAVDCAKAALRTFDPAYIHRWTPRLAGSPIFALATRPDPADAGRARDGEVICG